MTRLKSASAIGPSRPTMRCGDADAGAVDEEARRPVRRPRRRHRRLGARRVRHVAADRDAADLGRHRLGQRLVEIEQRHLGARLRSARAVAAPNPDAPPVRRAE